MPVIVLTAGEAQSDEQKTLQAGARAFFQKPVNNNELLHLIRATLPQGWPGTALPS
jgi:DNA-binding response OmpR family regulator